jgi:hypothetical protein
LRNRNLDLSCYCFYFFQKKLTKNCIFLISKKTAQTVRTGRFADLSCFCPVPMQTGFAADSDRMQVRFPVEPTGPVFTTLIFSLVNEFNLNTQKRLVLRNHYIKKKKSGCWIVIRESSFAPFLLAHFLPFIVTDWRHVEKENQTDGIN